MTFALLLDEHYSNEIATALRAKGHDVLAMVADPALRGQPDSEIFRFAAEIDRRIVTENIKDFRPLLLDALNTGRAAAPLLLVPPHSFPRGHGNHAITVALAAWLSPAATQLSVEEWLSS